MTWAQYTIGFLVAFIVMLVLNQVAYQMLDDIPNCPEVTNETIHLGHNESWCEWNNTASKYVINHTVWENAYT